LILRTTDGGASWVRLPPTSTDPFLSKQPLFGVAAVDARTAWAAGNDGVLLGTTDGGATWDVQDSRGVDPLSAVVFVDAFNGWVVGDRGTILHTTTGGR
jgi:photosystem II stability/assembly factor-like uncharacterized protein